MHAQVENPKENKSRADANSVSQKKSNGRPFFEFVDNRPEIVAQRKLQEMANSSPKVNQLRVQQDTVNDSWQTMQTAQLQPNTRRSSEQPVAWVRPNKNSGDRMGPVVQMVDLRVRYSQIPHIHDHIEGAIESGNPSTLTKNSALSIQNRSDAAKSYFGTNALYNVLTGRYSFPPAGDGWSWDEYPFACTEEGGTDSSLKRVPIEEQHIQGGQLAHIPAGKFNVVLADD